MKFVVTLLSGCLFLAGCAYRLGPTNGEVAGNKTIEVVPFKNLTLEPRLSESVTSLMRKTLQQDGTYRLETQDHGDIVVTGSILKLERSELSFQPTDVRTVRDYYLILVAEVTAIERSTGKTNISQVVAGRTAIRVGADLASAERQAVPLLAADLARNATSVIVDGKW
jgi:hypothetical protein